MAHPRAGGGYGCSGWARGQGECDSLGMRTLSMWRAGDAGLGSERVAAHSTRHGAARVYSEREGGLESRLVLLVDWERACSEEVAACADVRPFGIPIRARVWPCCQALDSLIAVIPPGILPMA